MHFHVHALTQPGVPDMDLKRLLILTLSLLICHGNVQQEGSYCIKANAKSCGECIQVGEKCGWCTDPDFLKQGEPTSARCDELESLRKKGCNVVDIENPRGSFKIKKNRPFINYEDARKLGASDTTQIQPQKITLHLRPGEAQVFNLKFKRAEDYAIDLYYLTALSDSMKDDLENVKKLGTDLMTEMKKITSDFRIGFGSFEEKTVMPDISTTPAKLLNPCTGDQNCTSPFSYKNVLKLTSDGQQFNRLVSQQQISGNLDSSKGVFDAIMQVAVCGVGHGRCECRVCICDAHYTGSACDCSLDTSTCLASNKQICNGRGNCECGTCKCTNPKFQGPTCEICPTCPSVCAQHKECVECRAFGTGEKKDICEQECSYFKLVKVSDRDKLPQPVQSFPVLHCKERDAKDCWFYYTYAIKNNEKEVHVVEKKTGVSFWGRIVDDCTTD
ncbi:hypothetical protein COCON_G00138720 [Conger conger]|uniref:Integrin beta n=1 Tax=Conger conger TaxID=82655 RepID=A0A9Q1DG88_CONCO|nr:hypothetical protein COCON_G00138720 [Conger conger]